MAFCLVTGGAGFIGRHVVAALLARGDAVRVVDDFSAIGSRGALDGLSVDLVVDTLLDPAVASAAALGVDCVIHLAALSSVPRSLADPLAAHRANVDATHNVLLAARDAGVRRVVFASSSSVYGHSAVLPLHEDLVPVPVSPYGLHKLIGEQYAALFRVLFELDTVVLRFFNPYGPGQVAVPSVGGVVSLFAAALLRGDTVDICGNGSSTRDFIYVTDLVDAVLRACEAPAAAGRIINVAAGVPTTINALYSALQCVAGVVRAPRYLPARCGDLRRSEASTARARDLLGFTPRVSLPDGLARTVEWHRAGAQPRTASASAAS